MNHLSAPANEVRLQHEHLYRLAVEQVADYAIFMIDLDGRIASWNAGVQHVLGWEQSSWLGQPFSVIFPEEDIAAGVPAQELQRAREKGCAENDRWQVRRDGSRFWASGITTALRDGSGVVSGFLKVMRDLTERKRSEVGHATQLGVMQVLAETPRLEEAMPRLLEAVCTAFGWQWGALWRVDPAEKVLKLASLWHEPSDRLPQFEQVSRRTVFGPGVGLPGQVWKTAEPGWLMDVSRSDNFLRREAAAQADLRGALCFPVSWGGQVLAVMEFFSSALRRPDPSLLAMMAVIGGQIGQFIERKLAEETLQSRDAHHAASVQAALDCIISMNHRGLVTEWNPAAEQTFGYSRAEALGRELAELVVPAALRDVHRSGLARYLESGAARVLGRRLEITGMRKDGSEFPVELSIIRLPADGPPAFTGFIRDISEQKSAEEARRRSEHRAQRLVEQSPLSTQVFAPDGSVRQVNRAWERLWGVTLADLPGYNILQDEQLAALGIMPLIRRAFAGEPASAPPIPYKPDRGEYAGEVRWCGANIYPVKDDHGRIEEVVLIHNDVTDRHRAEAALAESEARFRQLAETIPQLAWMARSDGHIFWYNRRWYEYTGTTPEQMEGWGWQRVHDPAVLPTVVQRWQVSLATGKLFEMEFPLRGADGVFRPFLTRVAPLLDASGQVVLWFGTNTDVTDQRRAAEEREHLLERERAAREEAERASRMKDEFLATLSHELRTPLNAILGWSQILANGNREEDDLSEGLRTIERNARAQTQIIEDLLDMSRIISGKIRLDVQPVDLASLVELAIETARPSAQARRIQIQSILDPRAGSISGDPERLQQVLWNLLSNAVKFTPAGGRIQVLLQRSNSQVVLSVSDSGMGISSEFLPFVFDRFRQADSTTTRRHGGLGIGLSIAKQLVELHGGTIRVESPGAGQGATFTISLPLSAVHPEQPAAAGQEPSAEASSHANLLENCADLTGVKVAIVDDEPDARALVKRVLENCSAIVSTAASAEEALELVQRDPPDVLVCDIGMPGADGYALIGQIRALKAQAASRVPAIALTAYARAEDRIKALRAGFQMHVAKPVEPAELITIVASLARR